VAFGGRELTANMVAVTAAIEIAVHGWDISVACGARQPVPPGLAAVLLPIAPLLITSGSRPGLFADPVRLSGPACPGDQLVAFLGRQPRLNQASDLGQPHGLELAIPRQSEAMVRARSAMARRAELESGANLSQPCGTPGCTCSSTGTPARLRFWA
jgi:hypothetical protein